MASHRGKMKMFLVIVKKCYISMAWNNPEHLTSRREFCGIPGQSSLKAVNLERMESLDITHRCNNLRSFEPGLSKIMLRHYKISNHISFFPLRQWVFMVSTGGEDVRPLPPYRVQNLGTLSYAWQQWLNAHINRITSVTTLRAEYNKMSYVGGSVTSSGTQGKFV
jgi:hypothetical protein